MFSPDIVCSDAFLEMPVSAQALYFHLAMRADDDGFVSPRSTMRLVGAGEDDLKVLLAKRFVLPFESGVVVVKHWLIHNLIRADLYKETLYKKEKSMLGLNENGAYTELRDGVSELKTIEAPRWLKERRKEVRTVNVPQTALRVGQDRLVGASPIIEVNENKKDLKNSPEMLEGYTIFQDNPAWVTFKLKPIQRESMKALLATYSLDSLGKRYKAALKHRGEQGCPFINSPALLLEKMGSLENFMATV